METNIAGQAAHQVQPETLPKLWILGASLGGFEAIKRFLRNIPAELPVVFIVIPYINRDYVELYVQQLQRVTPFHVDVARDGESLRYQQVVVAPLDTTLSVSAQGRLQVSALESPQLYPIDDMMNNIAQRFGHNVGAIIFSGLGDDGVQGCASILQHGGEVWVQKSESCVMPTLPDRVQAQTTPTFVATPEAMAMRLSQALMPGSHSSPRERERVAQ